MRPKPPLRTWKLSWIRERLEKRYQGLPNLIAIVRTLAPPQGVIVIRRLGLAGGRGETLREIASGLQCSPTHIRRAQERGLHQLYRHVPITFQTITRIRRTTKKESAP